MELNYEYFAYYLVNAFAQTVVTFTGQNYGAKNEERCKKIFRLGMMCSVISCGVLSTIFVVFRTFFIGLFTSDPAIPAEPKLLIPDWIQTFASENTIP